MSSREEFEAWLSSEYPWGNEALDKAFFSGNDDNGYYTGGDFIYDGSSCADALFWAWRGWQESHKQGEAKCAALAAESEERRQFILNGVEFGYIRLPDEDTRDPAKATYERCLIGIKSTPCQKCNDTGMTDSGGTQPWGEPIEIECDCGAAQLRQGGAV